MPAASILIKPASANCNMNCGYCFYQCVSRNREEYSKGFMREETLEQLIIQAMDYADDYLAFAFQGGEPTLMGLPFYQRVVALQKKYNNKNCIIENTIQTNGLLINEEWAAFLSAHHFLVGLSLDGPKKMHDLYRKDSCGNGTFERVMHTIAIMKRYHVDYNILSVITNETAKNASYLYKFYKRNHFSYVQLIPCMGERGNNTLAVDPYQYGTFLCRLFDLWYEDFCKGEQMDIRMFSNLAQMAAGYPPEECGMKGCCTCYFVVEGDGSVYPCDFFCLDEWKLGTVWNSFQSMRDSKKAKEFVNTSYSVAAKCLACEYFPLCRGGCRIWRMSSEMGEEGLNYLCPAYKMFFAHTAKRIHYLGQYIMGL